MAGGRQGVQAVVDALAAGDGERAAAVVEWQLDELREGGDWLAFATYVSEVSAVLEGSAAADLVEYVGSELVRVLGQRLVQALVEVGRVQRERPRGDDRAEQTLRRAVAVADELGDDPGRARALVDLGLLLKDQDRLGVARATLTEAVALLGDTGDPVDRGAASMGLGLVDERLNRRDDADGAFRAAVEAFEGVGHRWNLANALHAAGQNALDLGRVTDGQAMLRRAWTIAEEDGALDLVANVADVLGGVALETGHLDEAEDLLVMALSTYQRLDDPTGQMGVLVNLGILERDREHFDMALEHFDMALGLARTIRSATNEYEVLLNIGDVCLLAGQPERAEGPFRSAVAAIERSRPDLSDEADAVSFYDAARVEANDRLVMLAGSRDDAVAAFEWVERGRARELRRRLALSDLPVGAHLPAELAEREAVLVAELRAAEGVRQDREGQQRVADLERELQALKQAIAEHDPVAGLFRTDAGVQVDVLCDLLASRKSGPASARSPAVAAYYLRGNEIWAFVLFPDESRIELERLALDPADARRFITSNFGDSQTVRALSFDTPEHVRRLDELARPIVRHVPAGTPVCIVPHDVLHAVPFHLLGADGDLLGERHALNSAPSITFLALAYHTRDTGRPRRHEAGRQATAAVFGDPHDNLENARHEAEQVAATLDVDPVLGAEATIEAVAGALATRDVVHVAGHALFDPRDPLGGSGLRLADGTLGAPAVLAALRPARRAPSLVVLSACETGVGAVHAGDELLGLARGFLAGGVASLVLSLWPVPDPSTEPMMTAFHQQLAPRGDGKDHGGVDMPSRAAALQKARGVCRASWPRFYHWAPFVLVGDGR